MRVLLTHERFLPDWGGGGETIVYETARGLIGRGVDVRVLTTGDPSCESYEGVPTERLPMSRYRMNFAADAIARRAADADLIQTFNYHACWPSLRAGTASRKPVVCSFLGLFDDAWIELKGRFLGPGFRAYERHMLRLPFSRLCFLSEFSRRQAVDLGSPDARTQVVCPGIELRQFRPAPRKEPMVLFVGKFSDRKGVFEVIETARALPEFSFLMIGWGPEEERMRQIAPPNVSIRRGEPGHPPAEDYARARVFLFPSRAETLGLVIPEAMASGCAVVSSVPLDFQGARFAAGDVPRMIEGVRRLLTDDVEFERCSTANQAASRIYCWERYTDDLLGVYERVLAAKIPQEPAN